MELVEMKTNPEKTNTLEQEKSGLLELTKLKDIAEPSKNVKKLEDEVDKLKDEDKSLKDKILQEFLKSLKVLHHRH